MASGIPCHMSRRNDGLWPDANMAFIRTRILLLLAESRCVAKRLNTSGNIASNPIDVMKFVAVHRDACVYFYFGAFSLYNPGFVV